jgi:hypothetical protein
MRGPKTAWQIFGWPTLIGCATLVGLLSALIGDGAWDGASWLLLAVPVSVGLIRGWPPRRR